MVQCILVNAVRKFSKKIQGLYNINKIIFPIYYDLPCVLANLWLFHNKFYFAKIKPSILYRMFDVVAATTFD